MHSLRRVSSYELLKLLEEDAGLGAWIWTVEDRTMSWSVGLYRLLGIDPGEPVSLTLFADMLHPDDRDAWSDPLDLLVHGGFSRERFRVLRRDGSLRRLAGRTEVLYRTPGDPAQVVGVVRDVTTEHAVEWANRQLKRRFDILADLLGVEVWTAGPDGAGMGAAASTGASERPVDRAGGQKCWAWLDAVHPDDRTQVLEAWRRAVADGEHFEARYRTRLADGRYGPVLSRARPVRGDGGALEMWVGAISAEPGEAPSVRTQTAPDRLAPAQLRAARGLLDWSLTDLAAAAGVSLSTVRRAEATGIASIGEAARTAILEAFLREGVCFHEDGAGHRGVSLGPPSR